MKKSTKGVREIPATFKDINEAADFWDTHSLAEYETFLKDIEADVDLKSVRHLVALEDEILKEITEVARAKGISAETLINLWLREKLAKAG